MNPGIGFRTTLVAAFCIALAVAASGQPAKVEVLNSLSATGASDEMKQALDGKGYRVTLADGWTADFWFAKELKTAQKDSPGALYPELSNAEFVGVVNLPKGMSDFRGQAIPSGTYTLRYQYLPQDANHMGVSPNPDFLLAIPIASDQNPAAKYLFRKLVSLSAQTTGSHPAVIALDTAGEPGNVAESQKTLILTVAVSTGESGTIEKLGIVIRGQATQ